MAESRGRVVYADLLRILATFAVIVIHVAGGGEKTAPVGSPDWQACNIYNTLARWAVPVFVMLSGMFLLNPDKEIAARKIYTKYIFRVLLAIAVWGLFYRCTDIAISRYIRHKDISRNAAIVELLEIPFGTAWFHFWYLYMIIGLYAMTPIYRVFTKHASKEDACYLLAVFALFGICLPFFKKVLVSIHPRLSLNLAVAETMNYTGYFFAGYYLSRLGPSKKQKWIIFAAGILSFIITAAGTTVISVREGRTTEWFYENLSPCTMSESVMVFMLIKSCWEGKKLPANAVRAITTLSSCTFGIFLIHIFVIRMYDMLGLTPSFTSPVLAVPFLSVVVFLTSLAVILLLKKIPCCRPVL